MIAGDRWTPPSVSDEGDSEQAEIRRLRAQAERLREEIEELQQRLRGDQRGRADDREWLRNVYAQRERGPGRQGQQREQPSADERRRQQIAAQIEQKQTQLAEIETRLVDLGAMPQEDETIVDPVAAAYAEPLLRLRDANELRLWAHDPSVRPGATYRYRVRVVFSNPLFGLDENLAEQSREQAASSTITSPPSPWSSPVTVDENAYLFLTNASVDEVLGGQRELARFELYRFYYGYWRRATRTLSPGDAVTGALDLEALNLPVFEIGMSEEGVPMVEERSVQEGAFPFAAEGWFLLDVTRAPTRGGGLAGREVYQAVLRSPGGGLEAILPGEGDEGGVRTRLADSADAASGATIREPSLAEAALRTPERREQPDRSLGGGTRRER
jgi:chaperonin cofactor prefoldin